MSSVSVSTVGVSGRVMFGLDKMCKDYALELLSTICDARGVSVDSLLEGVCFPRLCSDALPLVKRNAKDVVRKDKVAKVAKLPIAKVVLDVPSVVLPFLGVLDGCCVGVIRNHNLYTQCPKLPKVGDLCSKCAKDESIGKFLGKITSRVVGELEFTVGAKLLKVSSYVDVVKKLNIAKDVAVADALRFGWLLSDDYFEEKEKVRGRPKKEKVVEDDDVKKCHRGRPKKDKKVVSCAEGDDLIAKLVAEVSNEDASSSSPSVADDDEVIPDNVAKVVAVSVAPGKKTKSKKVAVESKTDAVVESKTDAVVESKTDAVVELPVVVVESKPVVDAKKAPAPKKKETKKSKVPSPVVVVAPVNVASLSSESESEEEEVAKVVTVKKFEFEGKRYKLSSESILYDWDTDNPVGYWNAEKKCIDEYENSSEEESDEE